jgi:glycerophosphoryl diester phosphodiesterase
MSVMQDKEPPITAIFAHRGCTVGYTENTLDVRLTADGALAVHHDALIAGLGPVAGLTVPELPGHVPLLLDALAVCEGMTVNVEIKNDPGEPGHDARETVAALTAAAIAEAGWSGRVIVSSFQVSTLRAVQAADGRLTLGVLWPFLTDVEAGLGQAVAEGWAAVHPFVTEATPTMVEQAQAAGLAVNVWTVNGRDDLRALVGRGVEAIITDRLVEALAIAHGEDDREGDGE